MKRRGDPYWGRKLYPDGALSPREAGEALGMGYSAVMRAIYTGKLRTQTLREGPSGSCVRVVTPEALSAFRETQAYKRILDRKKSRMTALEMQREHWEELTRAYKDDAKDLSRRRKAI